MKVAFHFDSDHEDLGGTYYGSPARHFVFSTLLDQHHVHIATKVFVGTYYSKVTAVARAPTSLWLGCNPTNGIAY